MIPEQIPHKNAKSGIFLEVGKKYQNIKSEIKNNVIFVALNITIWNIQQSFKK